MTVIAYSAKHKVMASDSRIRDGSGYLFTACPKVFRLKSGAVLGVAGVVDWRDLIALLGRATPARMPSREKLSELRSDVEALLVFPKGEAFALTIRSEGHEWFGDVLAVGNPFVAIGTGAPFALGAMEHGASPVEAVKIACRRDTACGLPVHWERVGT